jgi:AIPR protein
MSRYSTLLNILDQIRKEALPAGFTARYVANTADPEQVNQERARAFIHLYLKVRFGLLNFKEREHFITDGTYDGGIDGYYVDAEQKVIYFIQSKFRTTEATFAGKEMTLEELLAMDVTRVLEGHLEDESGNAYNGKIRQLQREISSIEDIARYKYMVILLANVRASPAKLSRVVGGLPCEVLDYDRCYEQLVFPVISGTYFNASDLVVHLDLSNKSAGSKISYTVDTRFGECEITALFVPTLEIAQTFHMYKNSILKFNPRSYLELEGAKVNEAIRNTILHQGKNEFALYNNGITMLSDETNLNERIGQRNKAQLNVRNPQIINGGQTAYTLSRIYEGQPEEKRNAVFEGKEVLLKVITLNSGSQTKEEEKVKLIEAISTATNLQTQVITADRYSNEAVNLQLQKVMFDRYGLLFERKRGEFQDGVHNGYIEGTEIIERNLFFRIMFAANGQLNKAVQKRLFAKLSKSGWAVPTSIQLDRFYFAYLCFQLLYPNLTLLDHQNKEIYAKLYVLASWYKPTEVHDFEAASKDTVERFLPEWDRFVSLHESTDARFTRVRIDGATQQPVTYFNKRRWIQSGTFRKDADDYFEQVRPDVLS